MPICPSASYFTYVVYFANILQCSTANLAGWQGPVIVSTPGWWLHPQFAPAYRPSLTYNRMSLAKPSGI
jgi:hypothetical protein